MSRQTGRGRVAETCLSKFSVILTRPPLTDVDDDVDADVGSADAVTDADADDTEY